MWKTGHSLIKTKMAETKSPLAGEMSGHVFFADKWYGFDDALYAAVRLLGIVAAGLLVSAQAPAPATPPVARGGYLEGSPIDTVRILPPAPDFVDLAHARILIADDVADTGHTLRSVHDFCAGKVAEVRTACLYEKSHSVVKCDYVWKRTDQWINFPWSDKDPVAKREWSVKDA